MIAVFPLGAEKHVRVIYFIGTTEPYWCGYVGECLLSDFTRLEDAHRNPEVTKLLQNPNFTARKPAVTILAITDKGEEYAFNLRWKYTNDLKPSYEWFSPARGVKKRGRKTRPVLHVETGDIYESAAEVCSRFGFPAGNMSNHLHGRSKSIGGNTFKFFEE